MALELYDNAFSPGTSTQLTQPVAPADVSIWTGGPASSGLQGGQFRIIVVDPITGTKEIMLVTDNQWTANWTVARAVEGPGGPQSFPAGAIVRHTLTAQALLNIIGQGKSNLAMALSVMMTSNRH